MEKVRDDGIALDFEVGDEVVKIINVKSSSLPCPLLVFSPTTEGSYPILLFFHGFRLQPDSYKSLLLHISSHQYIAVAPKFSLMTSRCEVKTAKKVAEWLSAKKLNSVLPEKVFPDIQKVAVSGHSRGGKTAFALALAYGSGDSKGESIVTSGTLFHIRVAKDASVADLKKEISNQENLPENHLILMLDTGHGDSIMLNDDEISLVDYGVTDGSHFYLFFQLPGNNNNNDDNSNNGDGDK